MIPNKLELSGFTSYRNPVTLDFSDFNLACISGSNGAGKSTILDAITFALYGKARKSDDSLINTASEKAEVNFEFEYEGQTYHIQRSITRGKGSSLNFLIFNPQATDPNQAWKTLNERTMRDTDKKIQKTLRLDYETFVNASFFLQGKADSFATQTPINRKRILINILGLNEWAKYRDEAKRRIANEEANIKVIDARLSEIDAELDQEEERKSTLAALEANYELAQAESKTLDAQLQLERSKHERLKEKRQIVKLLYENFRKAENQFIDTENKLKARHTQLQSYTDVLNKADEIEKGYQRWLDLRKELEGLDALYEAFQPKDARKQDLLRQLELKRQSLRQSIEQLLSEQKQVQASQTQAESYEQQLAQIELKTKELEQKTSLGEGLQDALMNLSAERSRLESENKVLLGKMEELKERQNKIAAVEGATCPFCDQILSPEHRKELIDKLQREGVALGDQWRANKAKFEEAAESIQVKTKEKAEHESNLRELQQLIRENDRLKQLLTQLENAKEQFEKNRAPLLASFQKELEDEAFLPETRSEIKSAENEIAALAYDAEAHRTLRQSVSQAQTVEKDYQNLVQARSSVEQIKQNIEELEKERQQSETELKEHKESYQQSATELEEEEAKLPDLREIESAFMRKKESEAALLRQLGAARQLLANLETQRARKKDYLAEKEEVTRHISHLKRLDRAFSPQGVPALLIEQALPELEEQANDILHKLSDNTMSVSFNAQRELKDKKRQDKVETLDIVISDGGSVRDYETFSGGEAFRVNFAIRLALSRVLSKRAGARLQTLVIDEGFGNQDAHGRQLLIEAISMIQNDFEKILVITHIEELKEQFPNRIEVEKDATGSSTFKVVLA